MLRVVRCPSPDAPLAHGTARRSVVGICLAVLSCFTMPAAPLPPPVPVMPMPAHVATRDGRAILIDTGMLTSVYKGRPSALEMSENTLSAYYTDGKVTLH